MIPTFLILFFFLFDFSEFINSFVKDDFGLSEMNHQKFLLFSKFQRASINIPYFYYRRNVGINVELNFSLFLVARIRVLVYWLH